MGLVKQRMMELDELREAEQKEEWIRERLGDENADEMTEGWQELEDEYDDLQNGLLYSNHMEEEEEEEEEDLFNNQIEYNRMKAFNGFTIVEYEPRNWRLETIGNEIKDYVYNHFVLYDMKGIVSTDNSDALKTLIAKYPSDIPLAGDNLSINTDVLNGKHYKFVKKALELHKSATNNIKFNSNIKIKSKSALKPVLGVKSIAKVLAKIIVNQPDDSGMMIGIFGKWGRGKTFLADKTWDRIKEQEPKYKKVEFSAWKYQDTKASWAYLYEKFLNTYLDDGINKNLKWWQKPMSYLGYNKKIWALNVTKYQLLPLLGLAASLLFGFIWTFFVNKFLLINILVSVFGIVTLIQIFFYYLKYKNSVAGLYNKYFSKKSFSEHLGLQSEIENELTILLKTWIPNANKHEKIVLFVDDIDRCNIEQVISIVDGLRVILDNPEIHQRLIIITAIDENILYQALNQKYMHIEEEKIDEMHKEYLEKIFIIGIKLNHLNDDEIQEFLVNLFPDQSTDLQDHPLLNQPSNLNADTNINTSELNTSDITQNINNSHVHESVEQLDFEINPSEKEHLLRVIKSLKYATPRKVRIFYYKYLIMKQLFFIRLVEKDLVEKWNEESDEKVIANLLIHISNHLDLQDFNYNKSKEILEELKYTAQMVSIL